MIFITLNCNIEVEYVFDGSQFFIKFYGRLVFYAFIGLDVYDISAALGAYRLQFVN
ncbi:hypothetical protein HMPREF1224_11499 [Pseudomonas sp. P179]|nr:hypothetical protein HMPREF1224_11499 [Pseudomonas sp. P179]